MIYAPPSTTESAFLTSAPTGLTGTLGFEVIDHAGTVVVAHATAGITEIAPGIYAKSFTTPSAAGDYLAVWDYAGTTVAEELSVTYSAPVSSPSAYLTDLNTVREFMQKGGTGTNTQQDQLITDLLPRVTRAIHRYTRYFTTETAASHTFTWRERGLLSLSPWFLRSATSVVLASDTTSPQTLTSADWSYRPKPAEDGVYTHLKIAGSQLYESNLEMLDMTYANAIELEVTVTGDWGYTAVPDDVRHWATVTVVEWIRKDVSAFSTAFDANEDRLDRPEELPRAVKAGLRDYRRDDAPKLPTLAAPRSRPAEAI